MLVAVIACLYLSFNQEEWAQTHRAATAAMRNPLASESVPSSMEALPKEFRAASSQIAAVFTTMRSNVSAGIGDLRTMLAEY